LEAIDAAVARRYRMIIEELKAHGHHAGRGKAVAVALAARLAKTTCRAIAEHYGVGSSAVAATERRMADRPEVSAVVDTPRPCRAAAVWRARHALRIPSLLTRYKRDSVK